MIDTKGLTRAAVLAALYNAVRRERRGLNGGDLTWPFTLYESRGEEVLIFYRRQVNLLARIGKKWLPSYRYIFEKVSGKILLVRLEDDNKFDPSAYNAVHGAGVAEKVIEILRRTEDPAHSEILALRREASLPRITLDAFLAFRKIVNSKEE